MYEEFIPNTRPPNYVADLNKDYYIICQNIYSNAKSKLAFLNLCIAFLGSREKANKSFLFF